LKYYAVSLFTKDSAYRRSLIVGLKIKFLISTFLTSLGQHLYSGYYVKRFEALIRKIL
jgi:hypothetical protein